MSKHSSALSTDQEFIRFAIDAGVLRFGSFVTKAGRESPYFFNAGLFHHGGSLGSLASFYAKTFLAAEFDGRLEIDMLFGPAYKGITLASATAVALAQSGRDIGFAYNRKEAKDHGEGGMLVGAPLKGKVVIIDDVITAGTSVRESVDIIRAAGAEPAAVLIAMDRMERAGAEGQLSPHSAVQEVEKNYGLPVIAIANLDDILSLLEADPQFASHRQSVLDYRAKYGLS